MPLLNSITENFALQLNGTGTSIWVISCVSRVNLSAPPSQPIYVTAQGTATSSGVTPVTTNANEAAFYAGGDSRELQFFSAANDGTAALQVTFGKQVVAPAKVTGFYPFSPPALLQAGESLIYVKDAGFQVYDAQGLKKTECCSGTGTGQPASQGAVAAQAYQANGQTIANTTNTAVKFDTLMFASPVSMYGTAQPTRLVAPQAGLYEALASVAYSTASANVPAEIWFQVNGVAGKSGDYQQHISAIAGQNTSMITSFLFNLNAGDYVEVWTWHNNGSALALADGAGPLTYFSLALAR
jgi:hypothetical protein